MKFSTVQRKNLESVGLLQTETLGVATCFEYRLQIKEVRHEICRRKCFGWETLFRFFFFEYISLYHS